MARVSRACLRKRIRPVDLIGRPHGGNGDVRRQVAGTGAGMME
jgi:hypothetical protein